MIEFRPTATKTFIRYFHTRLAFELSLISSIHSFEDAQSTSSFGPNLIPYVYVVTRFYRRKQTSFRTWSDNSLILYRFLG